MRIIVFWGFGSYQELLTCPQKNLRPLMCHRDRYNATLQNKRREDLFQQ